MNPARLKAAAKNKSTYIGEPCKKGHGTQRYTINNRCVICTREASAKQHQKVRELLRQAGWQ
jgi:hypothetical protein